MATERKRPRWQGLKRSACCVRFADCVQRGEIRRAERPDETEWYVDGWVHLYYCPFCGTHIKGKGLGTFDEEHGVGAKRERRRRTAHRREDNNADS